MGGERENVKEEEKKSGIEWMIEREMVGETEETRKEMEGGIERGIGMQLGRETEGKLGMTGGEEKTTVKGAKKEMGRGVEKGIGNEQEIDTDEVLQPLSK